MTKNNENSLAAAILETADDLFEVGLLSPEKHAKITARHLKKLPKPEPMTPDEIRALREQANLSQAALAHVLGVTTGYISRLERGEKRPTGAALAMLNVIHRKGIEAIL